MSTSVDDSSSTAAKKIRVKVRHDYLTTGQVARLFSVSAKTAARWIDTGLLPGWRIPGGQDRRVDPASAIHFAGVHYPEDNARRIAQAIREEVI
jgi:excisionase family DNA binding protein